MGTLFRSSPSLTAEPISARQPALRPHVHKQPEKTTRVRTVLNEKQLHTLRTCYAANPRPDALMKEQLVEMTGLSPRVIRVWFQNKRCKDKKRSIMMKQLQQQQPNDKTVSGFSLWPCTAFLPREKRLGYVQPGQPLGSVWRFWFCGSSLKTKKIIPFNYYSFLLSVQLKRTTARSWCRLLKGTHVFLWGWGYAVG